MCLTLDNLPGTRWILVDVGIFLRSLSTWGKTNYCLQVTVVVMKRCINQTELKFVAQFSTFHFQIVCETNDRFHFSGRWHFLCLSSLFSLHNIIWHHSDTKRLLYYAIVPLLTSAQSINSLVQLSPFGGRKSPWNERASSININVQFEKRFAVFGVFVYHLGVRWKVFTALTSIFFLKSCL